MDARTGRRAQLLDTAVRLFAARGYNEVTIEDLAVDWTALQHSVRPEIGG